jgi:hypothetical protein
MLLYLSLAGLVFLGIKHCYIIFYYPGFYE